jgi:hypothetical protein
MRVMRECDRLDRWPQLGTLQSLTIALLVASVPAAHGQLYLCSTRDWQVAHAAGHDS